MAVRHTEATNTFVTSREPMSRDGGKLLGSSSRRKTFCEPVSDDEHTEKEAMFVTETST
jgi:hypothetical protein